MHRQVPLNITSLIICNIYIYYTIKQEKNFTSNSQNKINVANNININDKFSANNQYKINQINNVIGVKDKNGNESEIVTENKIQKETNQAINNINKGISLSGFIS